MQASRLIRKIMKAGVLAAASLALMGAVADAQAATDLDFDLNSVTVQAIGTNSAPVAMTASHTGSLVIAYDADAELASIGMDGAPQTFVGSLDAVNGVVQMVNGNIVGGSLEFRMANGDRFSTAVQPGGNVVHYPFANNMFVLSPLTTAGDLSGDIFAGVDVSPWSQAESLRGYLTVQFFPNGTGTDDSASVQVTVQPVPEPASLMGLASVAGGLLLRRRRSN